MALAAIVVTTAAAALLAWAMMVAPVPPADRAVTRMLLDVQPAERLVGSRASTRPSRTAMALSPDGRTVVFTGVRGTIRQLFRRRLDEAEAAPMPGTEGALGPFFSPDGQWVGFWADDRLKKAPVAGGPPVVIGQAPTGRAPAPNFGLDGASWGTDDTIVFAPGPGGMFRLPAGGGTPQVITTLDREQLETGHRLPHLLPGGQAMLYTAVVVDGDEARTSIAVHRFDTGERRTLIEGGADARYVSSRHLLYMRRGDLMAVPFDPDRLELTGSPVAVLDDVMQAIGAYHAGDETHAGQFDVSANGTLVYLAGGLYPASQRDLVWVERDGAVAPLPIASGAYVAPRISPDGGRIAFFAARGQTRERDIWVYDISRQNATRLTFGGENIWPVWSPDSRSLIFSGRFSGVLNLARIPADGSGMAERLTTSEYHQLAASWSRAGDVVAFLAARADITGPIWTLALDGGGQPQAWLESSFDLGYPDFSPDGRWLAYVSAEAGTPEVYVQQYPGPGEKIRVSQDRGAEPVWAPDGRELFYVRESAEALQMIAVDIDTTDGFRAGPPRLLFEGAYRGTTPLRSYDVTPDGRRFIMTSGAADREPPFTHMHLVLNWVEELPRLAPARQ